MAKKIINIGQTANDKSGDPLRVAFGKVNDNFDELYASVGTGSGTGGVVVSDSPPISPIEGSLWWDQTDGRLYVLYQTVWVDASPDSSVNLSLGNWAFDSDTATVSGTTLSVGKNSSNTVTTSDLTGTTSVTTTNTSQVAIDASSIVITRNVNQVVNDGVITATDEAGSVASIGNGSTYLKTYSEPAGPNNTQYAEVGTSGSYAYLESRQDDLGGYTLGSVVAGPGTVSVTTHSTQDKTWLFDQNGILTLPSSNYLETTDVNLKVGSQGTVTIRSDAASNLTTKEWVFNKLGTLTTPSLLPKSFTATCDDTHWVSQGGQPFTSNDWWSFAITFAVLSNGSVETQITNNTPWPSNPGYVNGFEFRFVEADHGIPGYTFTLTLVDIQNPGMFMYTTNLAASVAPTLPSTITSPETIKLTADATSWAFSPDGKLTFPAGGSINIKTDAPSHSYGVPGDVPGMVTFDSTYFYYCSGTYDGGTDIWHRVVWTNNTW